VPPTQFIDLTGRLQINLIPAKFTAEAQARITILHQGQVTAECLIPAAQVDAIVQSWRRARLEFPGEDWLTPAPTPTGSPLLPPVPALLQQLQIMDAIESALGDISAAESFCEDCRIDGTIIGNRSYQESFWFCNASEHLRLAISYLSKILDLED